MKYDLTLSLSNGRLSCRNLKCNYQINYWILYIKLQHITNVQKYLNRNSIDVIEYFLKGYIIYFQRGV